jgi:membrane-associated phospholipid phosphatase
MIGPRLIVLGIVLFAAPAAAGEGLAAPPGKVEWRKEWPKFSPTEGAFTLGATAFGFIMERRLDEPAFTFELEIPVIDSLPRSILRSRNLNRQRIFAEYSDLGFRLMAFFPYVFDAGVIALGIHRNPEVAAQLALIDIQALTLSGVTQLVVSRAVGRRRPYVQDCGEPGAVAEGSCGVPNDVRSFYSGHSAAAFTSAGLVCVHHQHIPLYGGGPVEAWACAWALGVAAATGVLRVVSDNHYMSDVIFGAGVGWFYGYIMPKLIHYRRGKLEPSAVSRFIPSFAPSYDGGTLMFGGAF